MPSADAAVHVVRDGPPSDQRVVHPAVTPVDEDLVDDSHGPVLRGAWWWRVVGDRERRTGGVGIEARNAALGLLTGLLSIEMRTRRPTWDITEVFLHPPECAHGVEIAVDRQRGIVGRVVALEIGRASW